MGEDMGEYIEYVNGDCIFCINMLTISDKLNM
jgi:hypothetical protein